MENENYEENAYYTMETGGCYGNVYANNSNDKIFLPDVVSNF